jgi:hypothetical protein
LPALPASATLSVAMVCPLPQRASTIDLSPYVAECLRIHVMSSAIFPKDAMI